MIKALLIAPYKGLAETAKKMEIPDEIQLDITVANLEEGVRAAQLAEKQGYELIISRGGTATLIQNVVSIPVMHIDITGYDMLRVFTLIRGIRKGVALVGFKNISEGAATICNILEFDVKMITIKSQNEVLSNLEQLKQQGFSVVIGDVITVEVAKQIGLRGVLITSGKEAVMSAIEEGIRDYNFFRRVNYKYRYFQNAFRSIPAPIVILNKHGEVLEKNDMYNQDVECHEIMQSPLIVPFIKRVLDNETYQWDEIVGESRIYEIQGFLISNREQIVGVSILSSKRKTDSKTITIIGSPVHIPIIGESSRVDQLEKDIQHFAQTDKNLCIFGEPGTGKYTMAREIHFQRFGPKAPILVVEGMQLANGIDVRDYVHRKLASITNGTVIVKDFGALPHDIQKEFGELLKHLSNTIKVIFLVERHAHIKVFEETQYQPICEETLYLSPLRERKEDIPAFADYFLAELHMENGDETVGIKPEAVTYLAQFDWIGNLPELKTIVKKLSSRTTGNYIELSHVKELMNKNVSKEIDKQEDNALSLTGTLQEIEQEIIRQVLREEGNNQSKAAERLGINRTTLWRKLKK
ncbi:PrpR N-terminal domain-containing protein [Virgibacillus dakarensis]|nr:PrpR N-terminal domain-containing protein [Virgibacillus dakarensis]